MFKEIYDISCHLSPELAVFPDDPTFKAEPVASIPEKGYAMSRLTMGSHLGTHLDAPSHILEGKESIENIPLEKFVGKCQVLNIKNPEKISSTDLSPYRIRSGDMVLFKTRNSGLLQLNEFQENYVYLTPEAARDLADSRVKLVGLDYFTIDSIKDENFSAHKILLSKGIPILEGIDLSKIDEGYYTLVCFPLKIKNGDGSPTRAVLLR